MSDSEHVADSVRSLGIHDKCKISGRLMVNLFAPHLKKLSMYVSSLPDPPAWKEDAFTRFHGTT